MSVYQLKWVKRDSGLAVTHYSENQGDLTCHCEEFVPPPVVVVPETSKPVRGLRLSDSEAMVFGEFSGQRLNSKHVKQRLAGRMSSSRVAENLRMLVIKEALTITDRSVEGFEYEQTTI